MENLTECLESANVLHLPVYKSFVPLRAAKKAGSMTIAAGFSCKDGVVLAADTLISTEGSYSYESKIFDIGGPRHFCLLAYSGDVNATKDIKEELADVANSTDDTSHLAGAFKRKIKELHKERYTKAAGDEKIYLRLLIAILENGLKWRLYCAQGQDFFPVDKGYQLIGIGVDTGRAVFEPLYRADMTIQEAKFLAIYGMRIVKRYVPRCGGRSQVFLLEDDWANLLGPAEVENVAQIERHFIAFEKATAPLLLSFAAFGDEFPAGSFDRRFEAFIKRVKDARKKGKKQTASKEKQTDEES